MKKEEHILSDYFVDLAVENGLYLEFGKLVKGIFGRRDGKELERRYKKVDKWEFI